MPYRVNTPHVIAETVGGETIIVDLSSGHYFNLQGSAVDVWDALERHQPVSAVVGELQERYEGDGGTIADAVEAFVRELDDAGLIVDDDTVVAANGNGAAPAAGDRKPFVAPTFTRFTDMQDIILLDPVHEVDARGWPHAPAAS